MVLFAEGAHGSLTKKLMNEFCLRPKTCQTYGIGIKEVWEVSENQTKFEPGLVFHSFGWPMDYKTYGGGIEDLKSRFLVLYEGRKS